MVKAENVLINFETLSLPELQVFEDCPINITYNGKDVEIYCDGMKPVYGCKSLLSLFFILTLRASWGVRPRALGRKFLINLYFFIKLKQLDSVTKSWIDTF